MLKKEDHPYLTNPCLAQSHLTPDHPHQYKERTITMSSKKKILLVEDEESNRLCLRDYLEYQGYVCQEAKNGAIGLDKLQSEAIDVVITDLNMPVMNGFELLDAMTKNPSLKQIPVLIATGQSLPEVKQQAPHPCVKDVLGKPYDFSKIAQLLAALFPLSNE